MEKNGIEMSCAQVIEQICEYLNEDVNSVFCQSFQNHLRECPHCCANIDSIRKTIQFCQQLVDEDVPEIVDGRLWEIIKLRKPV